MGDEAMKQAFRPLLPDIRFIEFNNEKQLEQISKKTACVIVEADSGRSRSYSSHGRRKRAEGRWASPKKS